jgi:hypothetical protein
VRTVIGEIAYRDLMTVTRSGSRPRGRHRALADTTTGISFLGVVPDLPVSAYLPDRSCLIADEYPAHPPPPQADHRTTQSAESINRGSRPARDLP